MDIRAIIGELISLPAVDAVFVTLFFLMFLYMARAITVGLVRYLIRKKTRPPSRPVSHARSPRSKVQKKGTKQSTGLRSPKQQYHHQQAIRCLETLEGIIEPGRKFAYLRKVSAYTFEEMVLEGLERKGHRVQRNERYSGDGGIDGRVWIDGQLHLVQSKRYGKHISAAHMKDFRSIVSEKGCKGLFVHTGRTGKKSWVAAGRSSDITVISGQRLLFLLGL